MRHHFLAVCLWWCCAFQDSGRLSDGSSKHYDSDSHLVSLKVFSVGPFGKKRKGPRNDLTRGSWSVSVFIVRAATERNALKCIEFPCAVQLLVGIVPGLFPTAECVCPEFVVFLLLFFSEFLLCVTHK